MLQITQYWMDVRETEARLKAQLAKGSKLQPVDGAGCYIVSVANRVARTTDGVISLAPVRLAAQRVTDNSHRLATDEEIKAYLDEQKKKKALIESQAQQTRNPLLTFVPPVSTPPQEVKQ